MIIETTLDELRKNIPGCHIAAFGDLSSGLILRSSVSGPCPREDLDAMSKTAEASFALLDSFEAPDQKACDVAQEFAISFTENKTHVFVRKDTWAEDMCCASLEASRDISLAIRALADAARTLSESN